MNEAKAKSLHNRVVASADVASARNAYELELAAADADGLRRVPSALRGVVAVRGMDEQGNAIVMLFWHAGDRVAWVGVASPHGLGAADLRTVEQTARVQLARV